MSHLLNIVTQSPAFTLAAIALAVVILAVIAAKITSRKPNNNGLVMECDQKRNYRNHR